MKDLTETSAGGGRRGRFGAPSMTTSPAGAALLRGATLSRGKRRRRAVGIAILGWAAPAAAIGRPLQAATLAAAPGGRPHPAPLSLFAGPN